MVRTIDHLNKSTGVCGGDREIVQRKNAFYDEACELFSKGLALFDAARKGGPSQLYEKAFTLFSQADEAWHVSTTFNLGLMHEFALGAELSYPKALYYYDRAKRIYMNTKSFDKVAKTEEGFMHVKEKISGLFLLMKPA